MYCEMTYYVGNDSRQCGHQASEVLWCPTWINAEQGPMHLCSEHSRGFKPEFNKNAEGLFYWGKEAHEQFKSFIRPLPFTWEAFRPLRS